MCLVDTPNDPLARRPFRTSITLFAAGKTHVLSDSLADSGCSGANAVINNALVPMICEKLQIEPVPLPKPKPLRGYDGKLSPNPITHCILPGIDIDGHRESTCPILIAPIAHDMILGKPWMNKHGVVLDMMVDKILFVPGRCKHDGNAASDLSYLLPPATTPTSTTPKVILKKPPPPACTSEDEDSGYDSDSSSSENFSPNLSPNPSPNPSSDSSPKTKIEPPISVPSDAGVSRDSGALDISEVGATSFYRYARSEDCRLFSMTITEEDVSLKPRTKRDPRIGRNDTCPCGSGTKYKRCCGSNTVKVCETQALTADDVKERLPSEYHDFLDVFDRSEAEKLPPHREYDHKLEFIDEDSKSKLPKSRIYPMSAHKLQEVKKYLDENLKRGFIVPSKAPFASPILFAEKPNGGLRFCVDYRRLNHITKRNRYPIPLIDEVLARIQGCKYLTRLDIIAAFNKLRMHPDSEDFTTFITSLGAYKYRVLPFGLTNGPASYQQYMNDILFQYINKFCQVYLDDILVYSNTKKEHVEHVRQILQKLRDAGLQVDILKCEFHVQETKFLGLLVSIDGLRMDPTKIQAVKDWAIPTNLKEAQGFLGFCNFYRRFIRNFSKIVRPIVQLTKKDVAFEWSTACQMSFLLLKDAVTSAPVLKHFDRTKEAVLETDSSDYVNAGVLSQYDDDGVLHPVAFYSKNLSPAECNYHIYDKELLAIIRCLEHWRPELECTEVPVKIFTDHKGLMYFAEGRDLSRRQARYLDMLSEFNIKISYKTGQQNAKADALTRMAGSKPMDPSDDRVRQQYQTILTPERLELDGAAIEAIDDPIYHRISQTNKEDELCSEIRDAMLEQKEKIHGITLSKCSVQDGVLFHKDRLWVPEDHYAELIRETHDQPACGHPGVARTYELLKREYYWRGMRTDVATFVKNCYTCQRTKAPRQRKHGLLHPLPIPQQRWQDIAMDLITGLPESDGYNAIWTIIDRLSKERHYVPTTATDEGTSSEATVEMLIKEVFRLHGLPASIVSDRGSQFIATVWKSFCKRLGIEAKLSTAFHPETDGQTERANQDVERHLRTYCNYMQDDWAKWISMTEFADNDSVSSSTGVTPFFSNKGFNPRMSFCPDVTDYETTRKRLDAERADDITEQMQKVLLYIQERMGNAQKDMAKQANKHREDIEFKEGNMVFLSSKNIVSTRPSKKLADKKYGPFKVTKVVNGDYQLQLPVTFRIHDVFHPSLLSLAATNPLPGQKTTPPPPTDVNGQKEFGLEEILDSRTYYGRLQYRCKWEGPKDEKDETWYNADDGEFDNSQDLVEDFHRRYPDKAGPQQQRNTQPPAQGTGYRSKRGRPPKGNTLPPPQEPARRPKRGRPPGTSPK